jgi:hypothetical protein
MRSHLPVVALFMFVKLPFAHGQADQSGLGLMKSCEADLTPFTAGMSSDDAFGLTLQKGYCIGAVHTASGLVEAAKIACQPSEVTQEEQIRVTVKYLKNNPEKLHLDGALLLAAALKEGFPCSPKLSNSK